ncbi:MAG: 50S ribosomal protein L2 [Candidatus Bathyarchaeota archaeon]
MGKKILVQRRGRGTFTFRAHTIYRVASVEYPPALLSIATKQPIRGFVEKLLHDPGRGAPLAMIRCEDGRVFYNVACEGMYEGQEIYIGGDRLEVGNILPVSQIPEGTIVCNVEKLPMDGGKFARASGSYAIIIAHTPYGTTIKLTSGKTAIVNNNALATIGVVAGSGRTDKPFMKAGEKYYLMRSRGRKWPRVRGVAMVAASHPFGGGRHRHVGKPSTVSRHAPPGQKVGLIAARRTGRAKRGKTVEVS